MTSLANELQHYIDDVENEPIGELLPPIELCLNEPLVSAEEAIASISHLFIGVNQYLDIAKCQCKEPKDNLTQDETAVLHLHIVHYELRHILNRLFRSSERQDLIPFFKYLNLLITGLSKLNSIEGVTWRNFYGEDLRKKYPVEQKFTWWGMSSCRTTSDYFNDKSKEQEMRTLFLIECTNEVNKKLFSYRYNSK